MRWRRLLVTLLAIPCILAAMALAPGRAQDEDGEQPGFARQKLIDLIEGLVESPTRSVSIGNIRGFPPFEVALVDVAVSDPDGVWLRIDEARLRWSPLALARRDLLLRYVEIDTVELLRLPAGDSAAEPEPPPEPGGPILPDLPVALDLDRLAIGQLVLEEPVLGERITLTAEGALRLGDPSEGLDLALTVDRTDDKPGNLALDLRFVPETEALTTRLDIDEPAGGLIARLAGLPGLPPVTAELAGDGTLDDWEARLTAGAGDVLDVEAAARIVAVEEGRRLTVDGDGAVAALLPENLRSLAEGGVTLDAGVLIPAAGPLRIEQADIATAAGTASVEGTVDTAGSTIDIAYRVSAGRPGAFAGLVPGAAWDTLTVAGRATGPLAHPAIEAAVDGRAVSVAGAAFDRLQAELRADPSGPFGAPDTTIALASDGTVAGLSIGNVGVDDLTRSTIGWTVDGSFAPTGDVALDRLAVTLPSGSLTAQGTLRNWGLEAADFHADLDIPRLSELQGLVGRPVGGSLRLAADATAEGRDVVATLDGVLANAATGIPQVDGLLGARTTLGGNVRIGADGTIDVADLSIDGASVHAQAAGIMAGGRIDADWSVALPELAAVDPALAGAVTAEGSVSGVAASPDAAATVEATDFVVAGRTIPQATLDVAARDLTAAPAGMVDLTATVEGLPAALSAAFAMQPGGGAALDDLDLSFGSLALAGSVAVAPSGLATGSLEGSVDDLAQFSPIVGQPVAGSADLSVTLATPDGTQRIEALVTADGLAYADAAQIAEARLEAVVANALAAPRIDADLRADGVSAGGQAFDTVVATAEGSLDGLDVNLDVDGDQAALTAAATVAQADGATRVAVRDLQGRYAEETFDLVEPAAVTAGPDGIVVDDLRLALSGGTIRLGGRYGDRLDLVLAISDLPLDIARVAAPDLGIDGALNAELRLDGTMAAPEAMLTARAEDVRLSQATAAGIAPFTVALDGRWVDERLSATASLAVPRGGTLDVRAGLPLPAGPGGVPALPDDAPIDAAAEGRFDLALLNPLLAAGGDEVDGDIDIALRLGGTLDQLDGAGTVTLADGSYRNSLNGTEITGIDAVLTGQGDTLVLTSLSGRTPGGGELGGSGTIEVDPEGGFPVDVRLTLGNAQLIDSNLVTARVSGDFGLTGAVLNEPLLAGRIRIDQAEIRIPETLPPSVATIPVTERNPPPEIQARLEREALANSDAGGEGNAFAIALDLRVEAPNQVFVRGRGLDAEMGGSLDVTGTSAAPVIVGGFDLRRGTLDLLGNEFDFDRGRVTLTGETKIDPLLDFLASSGIEEIVAQIGITGRASDPEIAISSIPELPEDEVLARILFGKATGELSALEAVQLAQSVATLTGVTGGPGLLGRVRNAVGLDRLSVEAGEDGESAVTAGRYVNDRVFIGVEQGLGSGGSRATVEIEVTPNIKVESDIGTDSDSRVGVTFEWEY